MKHMRSVIFLFGVLIFLMGLPSAFAQSTPFPNGTFVRQVGSGKVYLMVEGKARPLADSFTLRHVKGTGERVRAVDISIFQQIPNGEVIKVSPPKVKGGYDMHEHFRSGGKLDAYLSVAKKFGFVKSVFVATGAIPDNRGYKLNTKELLKKQQKDPSHIIGYCSIDEADPYAPTVFTACLDAGGRGLKLLGGHPAMYDAALDSPTMQEIFKIVNERDVPVVAHVSTYNLPQARAEFENLMNLYPNTRVQVAHLCSAVAKGGLHLDTCARWLDTFPNMISDISMGGGLEPFYKVINKDLVGENGDLEPGETRKGLDIAKDFIEKYQDRIVYGTDIIVGSDGPTTNPLWVERQMMCDISLLQEREFRCPQVNTFEKTLLPGFNLSNEILQKIFVENPREFLGEN